MGWQPSCSCLTPDSRLPTPCLVLDCFAGSGTTGAVAQRLGRRFVLIDTAYQAMQIKRLAGLEARVERLAGAVAAAERPPTGEVGTMNPLADIDALEGDFEALGRSGKAWDRTPGLALLGWSNPPTGSPTGGRLERSN